jgi:hypothetical protein
LEPLSEAAAVVWAPRRPIRWMSRSDLDAQRPLDIFVPHALDGRAQLGVPALARRAALRLRLSAALLVIGRWGNRKCSADWLDPKRLSVLVDEAHHHFGRRSSSAWAKTPRPYAGSHSPAEARTPRVPGPSSARDPRSRPTPRPPLAGLPLSGSTCAETRAHSQSSRPPRRSPTTPSCALRGTLALAALRGLEPHPKTSRLFPWRHPLIWSLWKTRGASAARCGLLERLARSPWVDEKVRHSC